MRLVLVAAVALLPAAPGVAEVPAASSRFASTGADRVAIQQLLDTYTHAVSTRDQALFETILLDRDIPFSYVGAGEVAATGRATRNYEAFRKGVFEGAPFAQTFSDVRVEQDGPLAQVSLVFHNKGAGHPSWGFKTMQLLRVGAAWKIASEFFTVHDGTGPDGATSSGAAGDR